VSPGILAIVWLGGGAFVASLLYLVYFYFVLLGIPAEGGGWIRPVAVNAALFGLFGLHHSIMPRSTAKRWLARVVPPQLERTFYVWAASVLLAAVCLFWRPVPGWIYDVRGGWAWVLYAVQVAGIALTARASAQLDVLELAGIRQVQGGRRPRPPAPLQVRGPFTLVRHPVYLGWILIVFAAPHMTAGRFVFAVISTLYLAIAVPFEERSLQRAFGESYREYQRRVRWRFLPWIY
jgi:protein-S-isoprenylcysteine O-methyltransferase Ste14